MEPVEATLVVDGGGGGGGGAKTLTTKLIEVCPHQDQLNQSSSPLSFQRTTVLSYFPA